MKAEDVANYLQNNPAFFEAYAQMLSDIVIPHPYGGRTISLSERQMVTLRERVKDLEEAARLEFAEGCWPATASARWRYSTHAHRPAERHGQSRDNTSVRTAIHLGKAAQR
jgi:hypothetical protein